jgi:hypothetical protein
MNCESKVYTLPILKQWLTNGFAHSLQCFWKGCFKTSVILPSIGLYEASFSSLWCPYIIYWT